MTKYIPIPSKENDLVRSLPSIDIATESSDFGYSRATSRSFTTTAWPWYLHLVVFVLSLSAGLFVQPTRSCLSTKDELLENHPWELTTRFDGSLRRKSSHYKGPPSKEVDKLWEDLVPQRLMVIPEDVFRTINASKHSVKAPLNLGNGRIAAFEGFHYVHCLHNLWKTHYPEYYTKEAKFAKENREEWLEHVDHCVDMLRQKLVCDADPGLITYNWLKNHYNPHPNFNVEHKCRSWDKLLDTSSKYGVSLDTLPREGIRRPEGSTVVDFVEPPFDPLSGE